MSSVVEERFGKGDSLEPACSQILKDKKIPPWWIEDIAPKISDTVCHIFVHIV
jgi:hypothetical protein